MKNTQNTQIRVLSEQGYTPAQIAQGLGLNENAVKVMIAGFTKSDKEVSTLKERYGDVEELAMEALKDVCATSENHGAKVMAAKILLEKKESLNAKHEWDYDSLVARLARSKELSEEQVPENVVAIGNN